MSTEILQIVEAVASEKRLSREKITEVLEEAIKAAAKKKYGQEQCIEAKIDKKNGDIKISTCRYVVNDDELEIVEIPEEVLEEYQGIKKVSLTEAKLRIHDAIPNTIVKEQLPPFDLGRAVAQLSRGVILTKVREAEREKQYEEFIGRVGQIVIGTVDKEEHGKLYVKLGGDDAMFEPGGLLPQDNVTRGERIKACLIRMNKEGRGPQLILSRSHAQFLIQLFTQEVPEIYNNSIQIKAVARDPGNRAKVAIATSDPYIDAVGSCVGPKGNRVRAVMTELRDEKIDIIPWSADPATLVIDAISPAEVTKVIIDEESKRIEVIVPDDQLSIAIGKGGQNVRLASEIVGWQLDVMAESEESKRRVEEFSLFTNQLINALDLEEILAQLLVSEGYSKISDIADATTEEMMAIQGLDSSIAEELISRAQNYINEHPEQSQQLQRNNRRTSKNTKVRDSVSATPLQMLDIDNDIIYKMSAVGIKSLKDLADLSTDEFLDLLPDIELPRSDIDGLIMSARNVLYFNNK